MRAKGILELKLGGELETNIYSRSFLGNGGDWLAEQLSENGKKTHCLNEGHPGAAPHDDKRHEKCKAELEDFFKT
jgi:hypothetical protein